MKRSKNHRHGLRPLAKAFVRRYSEKYGLQPILVGIDGTPADSAADALDTSPYIARLRACALREAVYWGEAYVFFLAPQAASWMIALVDGARLCGGCCCGPVFLPPDGEYAREKAARHLHTLNINSRLARQIVARLPLWRKNQVREAALELERMFYELSGWDPALLRQNRTCAPRGKTQAAPQQTNRNEDGAALPLEKERMLLALIRIGDANGARRLLNEMLGIMFLASASPLVLRARAIELMGYLARAAVEDNPMLEPLIARNHLWMEKLIKAADFDEISRVLINALDDFMEGIYLRGVNCYSAKVGKIMDFLSRNWSRRPAMAEVAQAAGVSESRASHLLKQETGFTFLQHVMRMRIHKARELLRRTNKSCAEIAYELGFCDQSHFVRHFRRITGLSPLQFRRQPIAGDSTSPPHTGDSGGG